MHAKGDAPDGKQVPKRRKRSRFSSSSAPPSDKPAPVVPPAVVPPPAALPVVSPVASLRARIQEQKSAALKQSLDQSAQPNSASFRDTPPTEPPPQKRPRRARSRFASANNAPVTPAASVPPVSSVPPTPFASTIQPAVQPTVAPPVPLPLRPVQSSALAAAAIFNPPRLPSAVLPTFQNRASTIDVTSIPILRRPTLQINQKKQQKQKVTEVLKISKKDLLDTDPRRNPYFDPALGKPSHLPRPLRKDFSFVTKGTIVAEAQKERQRAAIENKRAQFTASLTDRTAATADRPVLPPLAEDLSLPTIPNIPAVEWWDLPFIHRDDSTKRAPADGQLKGQEHPAPNAATNETGQPPIQLREERITRYIHHPKRIQPAKPAKEPPVLPLMLTKKETKKLRRQRRMETQKEQQELVAAGLLPPPPPKVKLSNMVRVLATEASADPTKIEEEVRAQVEARRQKHEADNEARKKSGEERREILREKRRKDRGAGLHAAVFRVSDLSNISNRFKVDRNARQLDMTGTVVLYENCNVVVVEGGSKAIRKYKTLMLRRIDWDKQASRDTGKEEDAMKDEDAAEDTKDKKSDTHIESLHKGSCVLVWEGMISSASFDTLDCMSMKNEAACRAKFRKHGVEHYWDLCMQASPLGNEKLGVRKV